MDNKYVLPIVGILTVGAGIIIYNRYQKNKAAQPQIPVDDMGVSNETISDETISDETIYADEDVVTTDPRIIKVRGGLMKKQKLFGRPLKVSSLSQAFNPMNMEVIGPILIVLHGSNRPSKDSVLPDDKLAISKVPFEGVYKIHDLFIDTNGRVGGFYIYPGYNLNIKRSKLVAGPAYESKEFTKAAVRLMKRKYSS